MMQLIRAYQLSVVNQGWRIPVIAYESQFKAHGNPVAILGALMFLLSVGGLLSQVDGTPLKHVPILQKLFVEFSIPSQMWGGLALASLLVGLLAILNKNRRRKEKWPLVKAKVLDKELRQVWAPRLKSKVWVWRLLCEFDLTGVVYQATPKPDWLSFGSESLAMGSLEKVLNEYGQIQLRINPEDPLETESATQGNLLLTR